MLMILMEFLLLLRLLLSAIYPRAVRSGLQWLLCRKHPCRHHHHRARASLALRVLKCYRHHCLRVSAPLAINLLSRQVVSITMLLIIMTILKCTQQMNIMYRTVVLRVVPLVFKVSIMTLLQIPLPCHMATKIAATTQPTPACSAKCKNWQ